MPSSHVLKDRFGRTVNDILEIDHAEGDAIVTVRNCPGASLIPLSELTIVPRAELLAGQVIVA